MYWNLKITFAALLILSKFVEDFRQTEKIIDRVSYVDLLVLNQSRFVLALSTWINIIYVKFDDFQS